jgi:hypothetical protein
MGNPLATGFVKTLEHDVQLVEGFIAIDGAANVIGLAPTAAPVGAGPYTLCKGLSNAIGIAGAVVTQPRQSAGFYQFTLDEPWQALLDGQATLYDQGAVVQLIPSVKANVRNNTTGPRAGVDPGTETGLGASRIVQVRFRHPTTGALTDLAANTGFWLRLMLKRTAVY